MQRTLYEVKSLQGGDDCYRRVCDWRSVEKAVGPETRVKQKSSSGNSQLSTTLASGKCLPMFAIRAPSQEGTGGRANGLCFRYRLYLIKLCHRYSCKRPPADCFSSFLSQECSPFPFARSNSSWTGNGRLTHGGRSSPGAWSKTIYYESNKLNLPWLGISGVPMRVIYSQSQRPVWRPPTTSSGQLC